MPKTSSFIFRVEQARVDNVIGEIYPAVSETEQELVRFYDFYNAAAYVTSPLMLEPKRSSLFDAACRGVGRLVTIFCFPHTAAAMTILSMIAGVMGGGSRYKRFRINIANITIANTRQAGAVTIAIMETMVTVVFHQIAPFKIKLEVQYSMNKGKRKDGIHHSPVNYNRSKSPNRSDLCDLPQLQSPCLWCLVTIEI